MPTIFFAYLFFLTGDMIVQFNTTTRIVQLIFIFGCTFLIPLASSAYLVATKVIPNIKMESRKDRFFPFLMTSIIYITTSVIFYTKFNSPYFEFITYSLIIITINVLLSTIITFRWKISVHSVGIGGLTGLILSTNFFYLHMYHYWPITILFILSGILMSARLYLSSHTSTQVYIGYLQGVVGSLTGGYIIGINQ